MTITKKPSDRLKFARLAAGFKSAREFCIKNKIPTSTYSLHESGERNLKLDVANRYAELLNISTSWLLTGEGRPYSNSDNESGLTTNEFVNLLSYSGNEKIKDFLSYDEKFPLKNPQLFCKIAFDMAKVILDNGKPFNLETFCNKAIEIFQDIIKSSSDLKEQIAMIKPLLLSFERELNANDHNKVESK